METVLTLEQTRCSLSWTLATTSHVSYIVAGLDQGGMINLIASNMEHTSMELSPLMMDKYMEMSVIAVGASGVMDIRKVHIQEVDNCQEETTTTMLDTTAEVETEETMSSEDVSMVSTTGQADTITLTLALAFAVGVVTAVSVILISCCVLRKCQRTKQESNQFTKLEKDLAWEDLL